MLNGHPLRTKLPYLNLKPEDESIKEIRKRHDDKKLEQKRNFDRRRKAKVKDIKVGDSILVRQEKTTTNPPFDPNPYIVEEVVGNKVSSRQPSTSPRQKLHKQARVAGSLGRRAKRKT